MNSLGFLRFLGGFGPKLESYPERPGTTPNKGPNLIMKHNRNRKFIAAAALGTLLAGGAAGAIGLGNSANAAVPAAVTAAADGSTSAPQAQETPLAGDDLAKATAAADGAGRGGKGGGGQAGPHQANGMTETPLVGDELTKATAAANIAAPGSTIDRAETDADGDTFEVHVTKADGSKVTVKLNADFSVKTVETGPQGGGQGGGQHGPRGGHNGAVPSSAPVASTSPSTNG